MTSIYEIFLTTVICRRHTVLYVACDCDLAQWRFVYGLGEPAVVAMQNATGCSEQEAWAQWADDRASETGTDAETIAYDAVNGDIAFLPSLEDLMPDDSEDEMLSDVSEPDTLADTITYDAVNGDIAFLPSLEDLMPDDSEDEMMSDVSEPDTLADTITYDNAHTP